MHPLIEMWNAACGALPKVRKESPVLSGLIARRMAEHPDIEQWREVIRRIAASAYCNGINDAGWRASFRFLLNERTFRYAMAGTYDDRPIYQPFGPDTTRAVIHNGIDPLPEWFCRHVLAPYNRKRELSVAQKKWLDIYLLNEELPQEKPEDI